MVLSRGKAQEGLVVDHVLKAEKSRLEVKVVRANF